MTTKQTDKSDKLAMVKTRAADLAHQELGASQQRTQVIEAAMRAGAAGALNVIAQNLSAQSFRLWEQFAESKGHEALGFTRFEDFLDKSPYSPMKSSKFYDRRRMLEKEGDATFDVLNDLNIPAAARRQLPAGVVRVEGDLVHVGDESIQIADGDRVKELIRELAGRDKQKDEQLKKGAADYKKLQKRLLEEQKHPSVFGSTPYTQALMVALAAIGSLALEAENLSDDECLQIREEGMRLLSAQWANLQYAYRFEQRPEGVAESIFNNQDLDELADSM